ncbi:MAG TPA: hypothetical protein DDZ88_25365 [Verrucomicrobiales bacterium]|nr:hypothetical protein [Verrucomicrobiales bacterium]
MSTPRRQDAKSRFETDLGNDGFAANDTRTLRAFAARHRFQGRTFSITIYAKDWSDALTWCRYHHLVLDGQILERHPC